MAEQWDGKDRRTVNVAEFQMAADAKAKVHNLEITMLELKDDVEQLTRRIDALSQSVTSLIEKMPDKVTERIEIMLDDAFPNHPEMSDATPAEKRKAHRRYHAKLIEDALDSQKTQKEIKKHAVMAFIEKGLPWIVAGIFAWMGLKSPVASADTFTVDGPCEARFSPKGGTEQMLVNYINGAKHSVRLLAYNFTSQPIADALVSAKKRGVDVQVVLDKSVPTERNSKLQDMLSAGIPSYIDRKHQIAHNKTIIVDERYVETGSFNYTSNAENNNGENAVICPSVSGAAVYAADWDRHRSHAEVAQ